ncbi:hypothetical protein [Acinetobacter haemolyticus]|uniref:hypothetical protein n=1 Tax=Acinetobacter haemolyticus TaxID=29430 RepID=UPI0020918BA6|nr:hypothetical protein [Acinetobacter haemolyticus]
MSDIEKAIFKAKLELETITPKEIQRWAIETLEKNPSNDLALELCFLSTPEQIKDYFKQISKIIFDLNLTKNMIQTLLEEYLSKKVNLTQTQSDFYPFFSLYTTNFIEPLSYQAFSFLKLRALS